MTWLWPSFLYLLILIPLLIVAYIWILRRRRRYAVRYSSLALVRAALPRQSWLRRHLPFIFFLVALTGLDRRVGTTSQHHQCTGWQSNHYSHH